MRRTRVRAQLPTKLIGSEFRRANLDFSRGAHVILRLFEPVDLGGFLRAEVAGVGIGLKGSLGCSRGMDARLHGAQLGQKSIDPFGFVEVVWHRVPCKIIAVRGNHFLRALP